MEKAGAPAAEGTGPGSGAEGLFGALVRQQTQPGAGLALTRPDAERAAKTGTGDPGSVATPDEGSGPSAVPAQGKASFSDALQPQAGEIGEKSQPGLRSTLLKSGSAPPIFRADPSASRSDGSGFGKTPEKVGEQPRAAAEVGGGSDGAIPARAKGGMGRGPGTAELDPGRRELQPSAGIRTGVSALHTGPVEDGVGEEGVRDGLAAATGEGMEKGSTAAVGGRPEASSGADARASDPVRGAPELLAGAIRSVLSGGEVAQPGLPVPPQSECVASLRSGASEPGSARKEGAAKPPVVSHHEKKSELHPSTGTEANGSVALSIQPEGAAGVKAETGTQADAGMGMIPVPGAPLHPDVPAPGRITAGADLRGIPSRTAPPAGEKKIASSPGEPGAAKSGDLEIEPAPLSHLVSGERPGHGGGHTAGELAETLRPAQPRTEVVAATAVPPKNPGGEVTSFGLQAAVQPVHAVHGAAAASPPAAVASAVHTSASATFERMDAAGAPQVIESAPHRLAVGVQSGGLGWVEIHTSSAAGQVSATLSSGSAESHSAIAAQLPTVRDFLAGEHVRIDHLGSERFSSSSGGEDGSQGRQSGRESGQSPGSTEPPTPAPSSLREPEWERLSYISVRV